MNLGPMMPGMPGMAGAGFPTPFGRMTDATNQAGIAPQMPMEQPPMAGMGGPIGGMGGPMGGMGAPMGGPMGSGMESGAFSPVMSNDKMVMAS